MTRDRSMGWLFCTLLAAAPAGAQESGAPGEVDPAIETDSIHWAYSAFLGTGYYRVSGDRQVYVFDMPFSWTWREAAIGDQGVRSPGVRFEFPVTAGVHSLDPSDDLIDLDNLGTLSFTPGVVVDWPVDERWLLRGYGNVGWGTELSGDERAWIWNVGSKARRAFRHGALDGGLIGEIFYVGYRDDRGESSGMAGFGLGADFRHPLSWTTVSGNGIDLTWDLTYRWYGDALTFRSAFGPDTRIDDEWRAGLGFALRDRPFRIWFVSFDQVGIGYRLSSDGQFRGITLNFSAPLDR